MSFAAESTAQAPRGALRQRLIVAREHFVASAEAAAADTALAQRLSELVLQLEPMRLGLYCAYRGEFDVARACLADPRLAGIALALPYARREPHEMHYRAWDRSEPRLRDDCAIAACEGSIVVPDVVLVPCVGFTRAGWRLGYGGGYFDRWIEKHPQATAVGIAWSAGEIAEQDFEPAAHDRPLMLVLTERGVVRG